MSLPGYVNYKDSGSEWLGTIPAHWEALPLKYLGKAIIGLTYSPDDLVESGEGTAVLRSTNVQKGKVKLHSVVYVNRSIPAQLRLRSSDVLICSRNGSRELIGKNALISELHEGMSFGAFMTVFRSPLNAFLFYIFNSQIFKAQSGLFMTSTVNQLTTGTLNSFVVPVPPEEERKAVASFLDHETAKIDALIREQERLIKLLQEKRQAVISHAVTEGLDPDVPMKDSGVEWLGEVPAHWEVMPVKFLLNFVTSGSRGWAEFYSDEGDLFFRITNLTRDSIRPKLKSIQHVIPPDNSEGGRARIQLGDILVSITADLGSVCAADKSIEGGYVSQHVALARPQMELCHSEWLAFFILGDAAKEQLLGSGYGGTKVQLSLEDIRELVVAVPPRDEQVALASMLHHRLGSMELLIAEAHKAVSILSERRSALISGAVTGKIDVRNWQPPADESAFDEEVRQASLETTA